MPHQERGGAPDSRHAWWQWEGYRGNDGGA
jgi:hypothetical protein